MNRAVILLGSFCTHSAYIILQILAGNILIAQGTKLVRKANESAAFSFNVQNL
jgi:hypothetical protein